jgi:hypothetical protein
MKRLVGIICLISIMSLAGFATTVERLSLNDMVKKAQTIVHGKVRSVRTHWSSNGKLILTTYTVEVEETIKGQPGKSIELTTIGGRIGDVSLYVAGMPSFKSGEDAVVFVEKSGGFSTVVGLSQGKFSVTNGEVSNNVSDLTFPDGRSGSSLRMPLRDFKRQIEKHLP